MGVNAPLKRSGFSQTLYTVSAKQREEVGTLRITQDGRKFRYAKAGEALGAGMMGIAATIHADFLETVSPNTCAIGAKRIVITLDGANTIAENFFQGGDLQVNKSGAGTGHGHTYPIAGSSLETAGTELILTLEQGLKVAFTAATELSVIQSPWMAVTLTTTKENVGVGVPLLAVPDTYYYWCQTGGPACVLTTAVGTSVTVSDSVEGSVDDTTTALDIDVPECGVAWGTAGAAGEYKPIFLRIE